MPTRRTTGLLDLRLCCPRCSNYKFGSSGQPPNLRRICQDGGCGFQWHQADDWKHFTLNGVKYTSYAAFEKAHREALREYNQTEGTD